MQYGLVAVFDNRGDARKALEALLAAGYARDNVRLSEGDPLGEQQQPHAEQGESVLAGIGHFLVDIFGVDRHEDVRLYADAIRQGHYVLTLLAGTRAGLEHAADLVARHGPLDIDEHAGGTP